MPPESNPDDPSTTPAQLDQEQVDALVYNTVAVLTVAPERLAAWREQVTRLRAVAEGNGPAWRAVTDLLSAVTALLDGDDAASRLPDGHVYAPTMAAIRDGLASGGPADLPFAQELVQAVRDFVGTPNWESARQVVEAKQALLLRPEVDALFERNIAAALASGDERGAGILALHRDVLRLCRTDGIDAAFARLRRMLAGGGFGGDALRGMASLPPDFVERCVTALRGTSAEKVELFSYLQGLAAFDPDLKPLVAQLQAALFQGVFDVDAELNGAQAHVWRQIVDQFYAREQQPSD
jgi:hypothetical protein